MASQPSELAPVPIEGEMEVDYKADAEERELIQAVQDAQDLSDAQADFLALKSMNKEGLDDQLQTQVTGLREAISALVPLALGATQLIFPFTSSWTMPSPSWKCSHSPSRASPTTW